MNSEHLLSLKHSIAYSQALIVKLICSTITDLQKESEKLIKQFIERGYKASDSIDKASNFDRANLLNRSKMFNSKNRITLETTY